MMSRQTASRLQSLERAFKAVSRLLPCAVFIWPEDGTDDEQAACQKGIDAASLTHAQVITVRRAGTEQGATL